MCEKKKEEESDMSATMNIERPCTILESLEKSCQEVKMMREGKIPKRSWNDLKNRMKKEVKELEKGNLLGDAIPGLVFDDNETVKVRIANTDTRVGKSNGYRMIYYVVKNDYEIYLLTIYYKKEDNKIPSNKEIEALVKEYCL